MRARGLIWVTIAAVLLAVAPAWADGPAGYQLDPGHTGFASGSALKPPLGKRWVRRDLAVTSFPVIAEGRVYVNSGSNVYALGARGRTVWSRSLESAGLAYDAGRLFTVGPRGAVEALSAATGKVLWVTDLSEDYYGAPTAYGDFVYVADSEDVHGIRQDTGIPVWDTGAATENLAPAVDSGKVYSGGGCGSSALQRTVGVEEWRYSNCGVGRYPPAVYGGRVYAGGAVLDTLTGTLRDTYSASNTPAFAGGTGYFEAGNELYARDAASGVVRWRYRTSEDGFRTPPVVAGGYVYAVTAGGKLIAVSRASGRRVWQSDLHVGYYDTYGTGGITAAGDSLVVSYGGRVVGYRNGPGTPGVDNPDKPRPARGMLTLSASRKWTWYRHPVTLQGYTQGIPDGARVEIQADRWPYGRYRRLRRVRVRYEEFKLRVRPWRNTRYRAVYRGTYPVARSKRVRVLADANLHLRIYASGRRHAVVRLRAVGAPQMHLRGSRWFVYFFRQRSQVGRRLGSFKMHGSTSHVRGHRRVRVPRHVARRDLFFVCRHQAHDRGFGRYYSWQARCGRKRLR